MQDSRTNPETRLEKGHVHFVGAGPGDPELLTCKAVMLLGRADVVLHDRLVPGEIVALARPGAEVIEVGKTALARPGRKKTSMRCLCATGAEPRWCG